MGCHVSLPPQILLELRRGVGLHTCGNCQRILVLADACVTPLPDSGFPSGWGRSPRVVEQVII